MFKKVVLISSIVLSGLALIASIYFLFFRESEPSFQPSPTPAAAQTPTVIAQNIVFVSRTPYTGATLGPDSRKIRYFDQASRSFIEAEFSGQNPIRMMDTDFENLSDVIWSPDKSKVIVALEMAGVKKYQLINLTTGEKTDLSPELRAFAFSPGSDQIAYNFFDYQKGINKIEIADAFGKNWRELSKIRIQDLTLQWPQNGKLAVSSLSSASNLSPLLILDIASKGLTRIIPESFGLEILWSPKGDKVIYSSVNENGQGPMLKIAGLAGSIKDLKIATFAKKCAWSADNLNIFCAVPTYWPTRLILPDDYWRGFFSSDDQIVKINTDTGEKTVVFSPSENLPDIQNLFSGPDGEYLFFNNKKDGLFYTVKL
jgi:hypothetical protein